MQHHHHIARASDSFTNAAPAAVGDGMKFIAKSKPIPIEGIMKRSPSEVELLRLKNLEAEYRDHCLLTRIINGAHHHKPSQGHRRPNRPPTLSAAIRASDSLRLHSEHNPCHSAPKLAPRHPFSHPDPAWRRYWADRDNIMSQRQHHLETVQAAASLIEEDMFLCSSSSAAQPATIEREEDEEEGDYDQFFDYNDGSNNNNNNDGSMHDDGVFVEGLDNEYNSMNQMCDEDGFDEPIFTLEL
eukprot:CAMPEP_0198135734 /NCGR_PEP_ID=MMETSP1442-20131203/60744_1 /TAXON_ID= /ORGANISM="Craspedostauros australis, Strain CCMP3328" /LENGTH=241 /DNA_ID=CAMNT_0043796919 /DNA_START=1471 /DNA_END=2196 /DNA_ORIENTATION=+